MFDRANTMTGVISMGIGEPDMTTPALVCEASDEALKKGLTHYTPNAGLPLLRKAIAEKSYLKDLSYDPDTEVIESLITPKTKALIQIWLGHSTFSTTADICAHLDFSAQEQSAAAMGAMFRCQEVSTE